jgi:hypothetical protein
MYLSKYVPKTPWIIILAVIGIIYGYVMKEVVADKTIQPVLL